MEIPHLKIKFVSNSIVLGTKMVMVQPISPNFSSNLRL